MWEEAPDTLRKLLIKELGVKRLAVFVREVTFYKNARLVRAFYDGGEIDYVDVIHPQLLIPLDGDSGTLRVANEYGRLGIDEENVCEYAKFFCGNLGVDQDHRFTIVDSLASFVVDAKKQPGDMALQVTSRFSSGYRLKGFMRVNAYLYRVFLKVHESGQVEMTSERPVGECATLQ